MRYMEQDIEMSYLQEIIGKFFLRAYSYNVRIPVGQGIANWYHDWFSKVYDKFVPFVLPGYYETIKMLVGEHITKDSKVLDLCCGTGNITLAVAKRAKEVIGLDASEGMLSKARNKARRRGIGNVRFVHGDVKEKLDFEDGSFDMVTAGFSVPTNVPLFQDKNQDVIEETHRVLKRNGKLILFEGLHEITDIYLSREEYDNLLSGVDYRDIEIKNINGLYAIVCAKK